MRVFILNGPPGIGKDTLAANIKELCGFPSMAFKDALYKETAAYMGVDLEYFINVATLRHTKDAPDMLLDGMTPRDALIHVSENIIKPKNGKKFFGLKAVEAITELDGQTGTVVFSDGGFCEETECLVEHGYEVHIIQLHNKDFDFKQDSRDYVVVPGAMAHIINTTMGKPGLDLVSFMNILEKI